MEETTDPHILHIYIILLELVQVYPMCGFKSSPFFPLRFPDSLLSILVRAKGSAYTGMGLKSIQKLV